MTAKVITIPTGALFVSISAVTNAAGGWLPGPFVPGSGSYELVPGGDFESGSAGWVLEGSYFGTWDTSVQQTANGVYSAKGTAANQSDYYGFAWRRHDVPVIGGETYVLSAFFYRPQGEDYWLYLDFDDVSWDIFLHSQQAFGDEWQFRWGEVTIPPDVSSVTVRLVMDTNLDVGDVGFIDDASLTPVNDFVPPQSLASGPTISMREPWVCADDVHTCPSGVDSLRLLWSDEITFDANDVTISDETGDVPFTVSGSESALMTITFFDTPLLNNKYMVTIYDSVISADGGVPIDGDVDGFAGGDAVLVMEHRDPFDHDRDGDVDLLDFRGFHGAFTGP